MFRSVPRLSRLAAASAVAALLAGCNTFGGSSEPVASTPSGGSSFMNMFKYAGPTVPASMSVPEEEIDCPAVQILDGTAAMKQESGGNVRSQLSIGQTARECRAAGGQIAIKVGIEGRALLGPGGSPGSFVAPIRFVVKRGDKVVASQLQRTTVTIPQGDTQASFVMVQEGLMAPKEGGDLEIYVGFDPNGRAAGPAKPRRKRG
jgi:predicted small secreted protein